MRRFLIKFCGLFFLIWGLIGVYVFVAEPQMSGDMGNLGKIGFGKEYNSSVTKSFSSLTQIVNTVFDTDTISNSIITIGDSFSQFGRYGYSQFVAMNLNHSISNIARTTYCPEQEFIVLVNNHKILPGSIVIVESVERSFIGRLNDLDFSETQMQDTLPKGEKTINALDETIIWIRTSLGMKQPIRKFHTKEDLFSHETKHNELYVYSSKWDGDGDLLFDKLTDDYIQKAYMKLYELNEFAQNNEIKLIYLVAADKYDVYEPFILEEHIQNPTLDSVPDEKWIVNTKPLLQSAVYTGVKDVYYINDTHWSPVGAKIVGEEVADRIERLYLNH